LGTLYSNSNATDCLIVMHFRQDSHGESYTVNLMTILDDVPPIVFNIIEGASNGDEYLSFWLHTAYRHLMEGTL
jgi:hypothetical protein